MKDSAGLTGRRRAFVLAYVADPDAAAAAKLAGYSARTARMIGHQLLCVQAVRDEIAKLTAAHLAKAALSIENVLEQLRRILTFDPASVVNDDGAVLPLESWPIEARAALAGLETRELFDEEGRIVGRINKVRWLPRTDAITLAMKHFNLLTERIEVHATVEHRVADMTPEQRHARALEILAKVQSLLPPPAEASIAD